MATHHTNIHHPIENHRNSDKSEEKSKFYPEQNKFKDISSNIYSNERSKNISEDDDQAHAEETGLSQRQQSAAKRKAQDPLVFSRMGKQGAAIRHDKSPEEESAIARRAAETRKAHDPDAFKKMGEKGGKAKHGDYGANVKSHAEIERE